MAFHHGEDIGGLAKGEAKLFYAFDFYQPAEDAFGIVFVVVVPAVGPIGGDEALFLIEPDGIAA